jgi:hypothetical protein
MLALGPKAGKGETVTGCFQRHAPGTLTGSGKATPRAPTLRVFRDSA